MKKIITALALSIGALIASASPIVSPTDFTIVGFEHPPAIGGIVGVPFTGVLVGGLNAISDDSAYDAFGFPDNIIAYCIELTQFAPSFGSPNGYIKSTYNAGTEPSGSQIDMLSKLFTFNNGLGTANSTESAAMQLAVWEIMYEAAPLSLTSGSFKIFGTSLLPAATQADALLAGAAGSLSSFDVSTFTHKNYQDFVTGNANFGCNEIDCVGNDVPEPGSLPLMLGSLGALGFLSRKKIQK